MEEKKRSGIVTKIAKFYTTGALNTVVDFGAYFLLVNFLIPVEWISQTLSYLLGTLNSYIINRKWTFNTSGKFLGPEMIKFIVVNLVSLLVSTVIISFDYSALGALTAGIIAPVIKLDTDLCTQIVGKIVATVFATVVNFLGSNFWAFKENKTEE